MKKTTKLVLMSVLTIALCVSLIAGATFALFTSDAHTDIVVSSGAVELQAEVALDSAWSAKWDDEESAYGKQLATKTGDNTATLATGATATYSNGELTLDRIAPGDGARLSIALTNLSSVFIKYRVEVSALADDGLMEMLAIDCALDGETLTFTGINPRYTDWTETTTVSDGETGVSLGTLSIAVELPIDAGNDYQRKSCAIQIRVFALQANAHVQDPVILNSALLSAVVDKATSAGYSTDTVVFGSWNTYATEIGATYDEGVAITADGFSAKLFNANGKLYVLAYGLMATESTYDEPLFASYNFKSVDLSNIDFSGVSNIGKMFHNSSAETLNLSGADFSNVVGDGSSDKPYNLMFDGCTTLGYVDFSGAKFAGSIAGIFNNCPKVEEVSFANADFSKITSMRALFAQCASLKSVDFSGADLSNATDMIYTFTGCNALESVDFSNLDLSNVTDVSGMFMFCTSLKSVNFSGVNFSRLKRMSETVMAESVFPMFNGCTALEEVDFSGANLSNVSSMAGLLQSRTKLVKVDFSGADLSSVTSMNGMLASCSALTSINFAGAQLDSVTDINGLVASCTALTEFVFDDIFAGVNLSSVKTMNSMFAGCTALAKADFSGANLSGVTSMNTAFNGCTSLTMVDFSNANLSDLISMTSLLANTGLAEFNFSEVFANVNLPALTNMDSMLANCAKLTKADFSNIIIPNATDAKTILSGCTKLSEVDFSNATLSGSLYYMFAGFKELTSIKFVEADLSGVTDMSKMFHRATNLKTVDFTNANLSSVENVEFMFSLCENIDTVSFADADLSSLTDMHYMFWNGIDDGTVTLPGGSSGGSIEWGGQEKAGLKTLKTVDFRGVTFYSGDINTTDMFKDCTSLENLFVDEGVDFIHK